MDWVFREGYDVAISSVFLLYIVAMVTQIIIPYAFAEFWKVGGVISAMFI